MTSSRKKRRGYTKTTRALSEADTRAKIVDATVALHEELGPARTTVSAIARRAGVERLTVYRHFPDEPAILSSCSARWGEAHPPPDLGGIRSSGRKRARQILLALYRYYRGGSRMLSHVFEDARKLPALAALVAPFTDYLDVLASDLERCWPRASSRRRITIRLAVQFPTWRSLSQLTAGDGEIADLVLHWLDHV
jgi:AcrR family transcriptional regulator